jgi:uncharacterized protein (DUF1697 family)
MTRHIVLLRGINVGGNNKLPMADLRASLTNAGYDDVSTYIQSGNVALSATSCDTDKISALIAQDFDLTIPVVVRSEAQLLATVENNPFTDVEAEPKRLLVYFCGAEIADPSLPDLDRDKYPGDRVEARTGEIYVAYREAVSASKLTNAVLDRAVGSVTTARNWKTVLKLAEMAAG